MLMKTGHDLSSGETFLADLLFYIHVIRRWNCRNRKPGNYRCHAYLIIYSSLHLEELCEESQLKLWYNGLFTQWGFITYFMLQWWRQFAIRPRVTFTLFGLTEGSVNVVSIECIYPKCPNQVGELGQLARSLKGQNIEPSLLMGI